jgi:hypothetical protein
MAYDMMSVTEVQNLSDSQKAAKRYPVTNFTWVNGTDIDGVNFVSGSEGKVKSIIEYANIEETMIASSTSFKYQDVLNPSKPTKIVNLLG